MTLADAIDAAIRHALATSKTRPAHDDRLAAADARIVRCPHCDAWHWLTDDETTAIRHAWDDHELTDDDLRQVVTCTHTSPRTKTA